MAQVKALFLVPVQDNDGRDLSGEIEDLRAELLVSFMGWSYLGIVQGAYRMAAGDAAFDVHHSYLVVLDEERVPELEQLLRGFKARTLQEAIYLAIQRDVDIRFI
jgi:hypothetical protein